MSKSRKSLCRKWFGKSNIPNSKSRALNGREGSTPSSGTRYEIRTYVDEARVLFCFYENHFSGISVAARLLHWVNRSKRMKIGIHPLLDGVQRDVQVNQGVKLEAAGLNDGNQSPGCRESVDRQNSQGRRAIDKNHGVFGNRHFFQAGFQEKFPAWFGKKVGFRPK